MHHGYLVGKIFACPVKALARRVTHIWVHTYNGTTLLCEYWDSVGRGDVTYRDMSFHMKFSAAKLGYHSRNIPLDRIATHSNRAGGACAMNLEGFVDESIGKNGKMVAVAECFLGIHRTEPIGVLSRYGNQNEQDCKIYKHGRVSKPYRVRI